jgi:hypothetical protein
MGEGRDEDWRLVFTGWLRSCHAAYCGSLWRSAWRSSMGGWAMTHTTHSLLLRVPAILRQYVNTPESRQWLEDYEAFQREALAGDGTRQPVDAFAAASLAGEISDVKAKQMATVICALRLLVVEHHSYSVMRFEHCICPVCTQDSWNGVLDEAARLAHPEAMKADTPKWWCPECGRHYSGDTSIGCANGHPATMWRKL